MKSDPLITYRRRPATLDFKALESFAELVCTGVARNVAFHCLITNDIELQSLNLRFRGRNQSTDVLSFNETGDIAISLQRARAQAREWGHSVEDEIRILILHGVLHLKGMNHETDSGEMARAESRWRKRLGLPCSLTERAA